jgi:hypothetical protein
MLYRSVAAGKSHIYRTLAEESNKSSEKPSRASTATREKFTGKSSK